MPLLLRIDNVDSLPDGGPTTYELDRRGIDIGRDPYLDWTLPDPDRYISGKHCEIRYHDGGYWLHDTSTNGTSINGRGGRLTEPYRLQDGDRVHIGNYIVAVEITGEEAGPSPKAPAGGAESGGDPWNDIPGAAEAVDRRNFSLRPHADPGAGSATAPADIGEEDIGWGIGEVSRPDPARDVDWSPPEGAGPASPGNDWGWSVGEQGPGGGTDRPGGRAAAAGAATGAVPEGPAGDGQAPGPGQGPRGPEAGAAGAETPAAHPQPAQRDPDPFARPQGQGAPGAAQPHSPAAASDLASRWTGGAEAAQPKPPDAGTSGAEPAAGGQDFIAAFERGAGLPAGAVGERAGDAFAEELGTLFRLVAQNLQAMLAARAETKSAMRSAERTMIGALDNNPLKFSPTPEDALRIMFGAKSRSYLDAGQTIEQSFADLQKHQVRTFGAMQQALQALLEDLDPESIEQATTADGGLAGIVGSRRAKYWDTYVERFKSKSARHERGILDSFMVLFADMYDRQR